ncbi:MAG: dienelactone hydrolase family protein, partial [Chloroflexi bacterium]|nr:dienelactone hydrolase family protein [Chloroflexota bacterium]
AACTPAPAPTATSGAQTQPTNTAVPSTATVEATATEAATATVEATGEATSAATSEATAAATAGATAEAAINIPEDDPAIEASAVEFPSGDATVMAYLARPAGDGQYPAVLVCHENRGLTDHIRDVTRRLAKSGYVGLAVDLLSRQGGTAAVSDQSQVPGLLGQTPPDQFVQDFEAGWSYLKSQPFVQTDGVGMVGFCFGGGVTWRVATKLADLKAAVPFYGPVPPVEDVPGIQAAVLGIYAGRDTRITNSAGPIEDAMKQNNKTFEKVIYPDTDHAFHNDTGERYNATAARDAWSRTLAWFAQYLGT